MEEEGIRGGKVGKRKRREKERTGDEGTEGSGRTRHLSFILTELMDSNFFVQNV